MNNNFEFGTPVHIPEESNSLEKTSLEEYNEYFENLNKKQAEQRVNNDRIGFRVAPETFYEVLKKADALEVQLAISDEENKELKSANTDLEVRLAISDKKFGELELAYAYIAQKYLELEQKYTIATANQAKREETNALSLGQLPAESLPQNKFAQKMGQTTSKLSF